MKVQGWKASVAKFLPEKTGSDHSIAGNEELSPNSPADVPLPHLHVPTHICPLSYQKNVKLLPSPLLFNIVFQVLTHKSMTKTENKSKV